MNYDKSRDPSDATLTSFNSMTSSTAHDRLIKLAAQLVGEYAHLIPIPPQEIIEELKKKFVSSSDDARAIILSAIAKIGARFEPIRQIALDFISPLRNNQHIDIQQRALEYWAILHGPPNVIAAVFKPIPPFKERKSSLVQQVLKENYATAPVYTENEEEEEDQNDIQPIPAKNVHVPDVEGPSHEQVQEQQHQAPPPQQQPQDDLLVGYSSGQQQQAPQQPPITGNTLQDLMAPSPSNEGNDLASALSNTANMQPTSPEAIFSALLINLFIGDTKDFNTK